MSNCCFDCLSFPQNYVRCELRPLPASLILNADFFFFPDKEARISTVGKFRRQRRCSRGIFNTRIKARVVLLLPDALFPAPDKCSGSQRTRQRAARRFRPAGNYTAMTRASPVSKKNTGTGWVNKHRGALRNKEDCSPQRPLPPLPHCGHF